MIAADEIHPQAGPMFAGCAELRPCLPDMRLLSRANAPALLMRNL